MTFKVFERVYQTCIPTGTGDYSSLVAAPTGFNPFSTFTAGDTFSYFATDDINWEEGIGTYQTGPERIQRTTIQRSSNGGAAVNWGGATTVKIRVNQPSQMVYPRRLSVSVAGGVGTTTLTQDQQRRDVLEFTGVLTGNRTLEVDATVWRWEIYNATTGAFSTTLKVTGQTGIVLPQGTRIIAYCDGTDVRYVAGKSPSRQVFTSGSGATYTTPSACKRIVVRIKGGGGGGAGSADGTDNATSGGLGGTTTFNSINAAGGGGGTKGNFVGSRGGDPGNGGSGTASMRLPGAPGGFPTPVYSTATNGYIFGGNGGGQGAGRITTGAAVAGIANSGGGGNGSASPTAAFGAMYLLCPGGGGAEGEYAEIAIDSPAASYTYTVGAGGTAGAAGTGGGVGGVGGSGVVVVDEYY